MSGLFNLGAFGPEGFSSLLFPGVEVGVAGAEIIYSLRFHHDLPRELGINGFFVGELIETPPRFVRAVALGNQLPGPIVKLGHSLLELAAPILSGPLDLGTFGP